MEEGPASAPREQGWSYVLFALAALFLAPMVPPLQALLPFDQMVLLLIPALAVCFVVGWWAGGRSWLAGLWIAVTIFAFWVLPGRATTAYEDLLRAWALMVAGTFGVTCIAAGLRPFLHRGLSAVGLAMLLAMILAAVAELSPQRAESVFAAQFALRNAQAAAALQQSAQLLPQLEGVVEWGVRVMGATTDVALRLYPALLALQGLAVLAVAWALYHRLSRIRIGPRLGRLRNFAFADQFVWGLVAGGALVLLPTLSPLQGLGLNLIAVFGALYALRGLAVAVWLLAGRPAAYSVMALAAALLAGPLALVAAFVVGVGDTWFDWRRRFGGGPARGAGTAG